MRDNEIIKGLEHCCSSNNNYYYCAKCPYETVEYCASALSVDALDLINRINTENADLIDEIQCYKETNEHLNNEYSALSRECDNQKAEIEALQFSVNQLSGFLSGAKKQIIKEFENAMITFIDESAEGQKRTPLIISLLEQMKVSVKEIAKEQMGKGGEQWNSQNECPICHGTGRIGTTHWLTKKMSAKQIAKKKAEAVAEFDRTLKAEAIKEFAERLKQLPSVTNCEYEWLYLDIDNLVKEICTELQNTKSADVVEVKHGEWIEKGNERICSRCDYRYISCGLSNDKYCPMCGAKMDGRRDT